jgi:chorismate synthase
MAKKILQLSEIKVKSFVTQVSKSEQRTAKGGYVHNSKLAAIIVDINTRPSWTEYKTRATGDSNTVKFFDGNEG